MLTNALGTVGAAEHKAHFEALAGPRQARICQPDSHASLRFDNVGFDSKAHGVPGRVK